MTSDSGMTPERAREIADNIAVDFATEDVEKVLSRRIEAALNKVFLQGVAYQEEKAKGLVEKIEEFRDIVLHERGALAELTEGNSDFINAILAEFDATIGDALAHYRQGQEKNDGR